jgi:hypothetical protein
MPDDALESVLRLVADGRLTAQEAGPILDALGATQPAGSQPRPDPARSTAAAPGGGAGRAIRLEVTDAGRKVVGLRVPLALGRAALERIPGISEATSQRIRDAIETGLTGPILDVDDPEGDRVRIVIE